MTRAKHRKPGLPSVSKKYTDLPTAEVMRARINAALGRGPVMRGRVGWQQYRDLIEGKA